MLPPIFLSDSIRTRSSLLNSFGLGSILSGFNLADVQRPIKLPKLSAKSPYNTILSQRSFGGPSPSNEEIADRLKNHHRQKYPLHSIENIEQGLIQIYLSILWDSQHFPNFYSFSPYQQSNMHEKLIWSVGFGGDTKMKIYLISWEEVI